MPTTAETKVPQRDWNLALARLAFPNVSSFTHFLASVGVAPEQLGLNSKTGEVSSFGTYLAIYMGPQVTITGHGIELLAKATQRNLEAVVAAAKRAGAYLRQLTSDLLPEGLNLNDTDLRLPSRSRINSPPVKKTIDLALAPRRINELLDDGKGAGKEFFLGRGNLHAEASIGEIANREIGRRQLHMRALNAAMKEAGFPEYDAQEAFFLASVCTDQVTVSEPIITSSARVASVNASLGLCMPESSTNGIDPYTYFNRDVFGYGVSFGFARATLLSAPNGPRSFTVCFPIIGLDERLSLEILKLERETPKQDESPEELFIRAVRFIWSASTMGGHDHIHALVSDLTWDFPDAPFVQGGLKGKCAEIQGRYKGLGNEVHATLIQGSAFKMMNQINPDIRIAMFRQSFQFVNNVARLSDQGLSHEAAAYLLFVGFSHLSAVVSPYEGIVGEDSQTIMNFLEDRLPALKGNGMLARLNDLLKNGPVAWATVSGSFAAAEEVTPLEDLSFGGAVNDFNAAHSHHLFGLLNELNSAFKDFTAANKGAYEQLGTLDGRVKFKGSSLPVRTFERD